MSRSLWRGKSSGNGEWIYGSLVENSEGSFILPTDESIFVDWPQMPELGCGIEDRGYQKDGYSAVVYGWEEGLERFNEMLPNWCEVDDDSVGMASEYRDTTYHPVRHSYYGKQIFEKDIIMIKVQEPFIAVTAIEPPEYNTYFELVEFRDGAFYAGRELLSNHMSMADDVEVVGNIVDRPELAQLCTIKEEWE